MNRGRKLEQDTTSLPSNVGCMYLYINVYIVRVGITKIRIPLLDTTVVPIEENAQRPGPEENREVS
jgi:hypothetical protein